ncbi:MAG: hypothetical protein IJI59_12860 [Clostridia bacterium]|nr:hypothetical protein [Clostridia bacterium]
MTAGKVGPALAGHANAPGGIAAGQVHDPAVLHLLDQPVHGLEPRFYEDRIRRKEPLDLLMELLRDGLFRHLRAKRLEAQGVQQALGVRVSGRRVQLHAGLCRVEHGIDELPQFLIIHL